MFKIIFTIFLGLIALFIIYQIILERKRNRKPKVKLEYNRDKAIDIYKNLVETYGYVPRPQVKPMYAIKRVPLVLADIKGKPKAKLTHKKKKLKHKWTK